MFGLKTVNHVASLFSLSPQEGDPDGGGDSVHAGGTRGGRAVAARYPRPAEGNGGEEGLRALKGQQGPAPGGCHQAKK